jgi:hypothetical protein
MHYYYSHILRKILLFPYKGTTIAVCALEIIVKGVLVFLQFLTITKNEVNLKTKMLRLVVSHNSLCYLFQRLCTYISHNTYQGRVINYASFMNSAT